MKFIYFGIHKEYIGCFNLKSIYRLCNKICFCKKFNYFSVCIFETYRKYTKYLHVFFKKQKYKSSESSYKNTEMFKIYVKTR